jgi:uncharacterized protein (DUF433 family)
MAAKHQPTTVRLSAVTEELIQDEARRTRRSKSAVLQSLADEGIRQRRFPGIAFRGRDPQRRAWAIGTGLDVWQIVEAYRDFGESIERMAAETDLDEPQIRLAIAYYERFPGEIDEAIAENQAIGEEFGSRFPSFEIRA